MKVFSTIFLLLGFFTMTNLNVSFGDKKEDVAAQITAAYFDDFRLFQKQVRSFTKLCREAENQLDLSMLRQDFLTTKHAYKRIEFLFDYHRTEYNYLYVNGGPLPKYNEESADIVEPLGLQAIEELLFGEEAAEQIEEIGDLAVELRKAIDLIVELHLINSITDQRIIEAMRSGIVRVFTLGLTGFDTPASGNAINEASVSLQTMEKAFLFYGKSEAPKVKKKFQEIKTLFQKGLKILNDADDFDRFDRMAFLKQIINPLYEKLYDFQIAKGIPTAQYKIHSQDYNSRNLFAEDFLSTDVFAEFVFTPLNNPATIELGKTLFYDPILSKDMKMSCASCHNPTKAFTDGLPKSQANVSGKFTKRNAPTLIDVCYSSRFFWDMRDYNLERQVAHVVGDTLEFNSSFNLIAERLRQSQTYVDLFEKSYHGIAKKTIYSRTISNAIAAYVNSLKSFNSDFDKFVRDEITGYPEEAINGFNLFMGKAACGTCHFAPVFNGSVPPFYEEAESEVLGITTGFDTIQPQKDLDPGRMNNGLRREAVPHFANSFKTVTVRNAALTAPYMHNGLFKTLEEVLEFYNLGGGAGMGLPIENQTLSDAPLNLSEKEKSDIIVFMKTLTDTTGLTNAAVVFPKFETHPEWNNRAVDY